MVASLPLVRAAGMTSTSCWSRTSTGLGTTGNLTVNTLPSPWVDRTPMVPPISSTRRLERLRPMPVPSMSEPSAPNRSNGVKTRFMFSGEVEDLVDQAEEVPPGLQDVLDALGLIIVEPVHLQELPEPQHGVERGPQLVAHAREELALGLVGCAQHAVGLVQLPGPPEDLALHLLGAVLEVFRLLLVLGLEVPQAHELGDVLDPVDDPGQPAVDHDRGVAGTPVADLEPSALRFGATDVVLLNAHHVGGEAGAYQVE